MTTIARVAGPARTARTARVTEVREFRLPDLGEGLTESEIVQWHVREGDTVELNQIIADVETAKAVVELPSPYAGVVVRLHETIDAPTSTVVPAASFEVPVEPVEPDDGACPSSRVAATTPLPVAGDDRTGAGAPARREPNLVGYGAAVERGGRPRRRGRQVPSTSTAGTLLVERSEDAARAGDRPRSTPPVRKLARDLGITLDGLTGTGADALITRADVLAAVAGAGGGPAVGAGGGPAVGAAPARPTAHTSATEAPDVPATPVRATRTPIKGVRKHTAAAMVASAFTAPHVTEFLTVDVTPTMELLASLRTGRAFAGTKVTPLTIVAKAVCLAVGRTPGVNSSWDEQAQEIVQYQDVNLGIAAATPRGLLVPNIKGAQSLQLVDLARALGSLADTARAGRTPPADLAGGTISITNIGVFGIDAGTPILNPGEAVILAMGAVRRTPWEYRDAVALRSVMTLSMSFDHRLVDGEQGSRFLADVGTILSDPAMVLTMV